MTLKETVNKKKIYEKKMARGILKELAQYATQDAPWLERKTLELFHDKIHFALQRGNVRVQLDALRHQQW